MPAFGDAMTSVLAERHSVGNLKRTLVDHGLATDWFDSASSEGPVLLRHAVAAVVVGGWKAHGCAQLLGGHRGARRASARDARVGPVGRR